MGLRTDTLFYAQILGIFLFIQYFETDLIFSDSQVNSKKAPVSSLQGILRQVSDPSALYYYGTGVYGLLALLAVGRIIRPSLPDLFYVITLGFNAYWYVSYFQPAIKQFTNFATPDTARAFFPQLFFYQNVYLLSVFLLLVESLLASFVYYVIDPIENVLLNVLLGVLLVDLSYDIPFLANPVAKGSQHFNHITHGIGSSFLELQVPLIIVAVGVIVLYRVLVQRSHSDFVFFLLFAAAAAGFQVFLVPIETSLSKTSYSQNNTLEDQKRVAYVHVAFAIIILAVTSFKWTSSWWSYQRPTSPAKKTTEKSTTTTTATVTTGTPKKEKEGKKNK